ncbi:MAG: hypothetical protein LIP23_03535 [Planctomycetes bacterium]|nr:hypothetical protein [Planctomycetota bacterium]
MEFRLVVNFGATSNVAQRTLQQALSAVDPAQPHGSPLFDGWHAGMTGAGCAAGVFQVFDNFFAPLPWCRVMCDAKPIFKEK